MKATIRNVLCAVLLLAVPVFAATPNRPNILFILADNWRWPTAGALGDPMALTPAFASINFHTTKTQAGDNHGK